MQLPVEVLKSLIENSSLDYRKKNVVGKCPWCGGEEWGISVGENHRFGCYRRSKCGETGNIFKLLKKLNRLDLLRDPDNVTISSSTYLENIFETTERILSELPEIQPPIGFRRVKSHPYLIDRGFTDEDFTTYEIGITKLDSKLKDYVIFLIRQKGRLVAYVARFTKSKEEIKQIEESTGKRILRYKNSSTDFESLLLGYDEITKNTKTVILVEGLFGKRNIDEKLQLHIQEQIKCLCTFGAKISDTQLLLLHLVGINDIILLYDPDVVQYIKKYSARLSDEYESVRVGLITQEDKDPADLSEEEVVQVLSELKDVLNFQINTVQILNLK